LAKDFVKSLIPNYMHGVGFRNFAEKNGCDSKCPESNCGPRINILKELEKKEKNPYPTRIKNGYFG